VKVLGPLVQRDLPERATADAIAAWRDAGTVWQRRAANVAFVNLARRGEANFPGFTALMRETCAVTVRSEARFAQTGVGWLLRELAESDRAAVLAFTRDHLGLMSREAVRYVTERMPEEVRRPVLDAHKAACAAQRPARARETQEKAARPRRR
jgi:3-methyladenine DNA glycosylase AlkD